jgi:hypothetical protein
MNWNLEGLRVVGRYMDTVRVSGVVTLSRVAYGGMVQHHVQLDKGFNILKGAVKREAGEYVILEHPYIHRVMSGNSVEA